MTDGRPRIGVSSCLLGQEVRYNGGHSRSRFLTNELAPYVDWVPYCPEIEIGLGAPRELDRARRADLPDRIEAYRRGQHPFGVPVALLAHYAKQRDAALAHGADLPEPVPRPLRLWQA